MRVLVMGRYLGDRAAEYSIKDRETGETNEGVSRRVYVMGLDVNEGPAEIRFRSDQDSARLHRAIGEQYTFGDPILLWCSLGAESPTAGRAAAILYAAEVTTADSLASLLG